MDYHIYAAFVGIFGLFLGSFLHVVADRLYYNESIFFGRSHCDSCNKALKWYELLPIVSFVMQEGKCRNCKTPLSFWYPLSELLTAVVFSIVTIVFIPQGILITVLYLLISASLIAIFLADIKHGIIPFPLVIVAFLSALIIHSVTHLSVIPLHMIAGIAGGGFFLIIFLATKGKGMGFGDVVYAFFMGFLLGFPGIFLGLYIAFLTGAVISLLLVLLKKKKLHGGSIPFGPFLVLGTFLVMLAGPALVQMISSYLF